MVVNGTGDNSSRHASPCRTKVVGTLRRAVRSQAFGGSFGGRHMECAYYFGACRTKVAGTLRRAVRSQAFDRSFGGRHMECAYYIEFCRLWRDRSRYFDSTIDSKV
jgi:hypothetical protein